MLELRRALPILLLSALAAVAAEPAADAAPTDNTEVFLNTRLSFWQERLNLREWKVSIVMTPRTALKPGTLGQIRWDKSKKSAVIWIVDEADYKLSADQMLKDMEFTIVHELIHLELASLPRSEASRRTEEHAVNNIARALISMNTAK